jgi:iron(III) transport system substrate-binding protein
MKKRFLTASLATMMVLSLAACGGGKAADTTTAPAATEAPADTKAEDKAEETKAEETKAEEDTKSSSSGLSAATVLDIRPMTRIL